jgi:integrase
MAGTVRKRTWVTRKGEQKTAWTANYKDQAGSWRLKTFPTKKAADAWLLQARGEVRDGVHTPDSASITVAEAGELWLQRARINGLERGSQRAYDQLVRLAINPLIGQIKLSRLTRPMVESFRDDLLQQFAYLRARRALGTLRAIVAHAQARGLVAQNVAAAVRIGERSRLQERLVIGRTIPTPEEVRGLTAAAEGWLRAMVFTAAFTGMREGELRGLTWRDVDFTARTITVRQRADQWGTAGPPKSKAGQRVLDMAPTIIEELRRWRLASGSPVAVFPGRAPDTVIGQNSVILAFGRLQQRAGIVDAAGQPKYTFHALRHFFASAMIGFGYTSKWLQVTMGHENIVLTLGTYGHLFPESEDAPARMARLEALVAGAPA